MYQIKRIINNNVVHAINDSSEEVVLMGKGIGFKRQPSQCIDPKEVEKLFRLSEGNERLAALFDGVDLKYIEIVEKSVAIAQNSLNGKLSDTLFLTLLDHISFSIERAKEGIVLKSPLHWEVLRLYQEEVKIAKEIHKYLNDNLDVILPDEEVNMIALHIVNAQNDSSKMKDTMISTMISNEIVDIVRYEYRREFDEEEFHFNRFLVHLRYFVLRHLNNSSFEEKPSTMFSIAGVSYPKALSCVEKICDFLNKEYEWQINNDERLYLLIHIEKFAN